ncbi:MAG: hypothetical protein N3G77_07845 [Nitrososphaeria archaeon]|nr:hypothetical protein [Nitrososphaeria archaeon]
MVILTLLLGTALGSQLFTRIETVTLTNFATSTITESITSVKTETKVVTVTQIIKSIESRTIHAEDRLILTKAGATHYEVRLESTDTMLIYLEPDMWQGNSDVYPVTGGQRVGHHWSQFLMLSPGRWLTDRVESEGQFLIDFKIFKERGWMIIYAGRWGFRDYFITDAIHYIWIEDGILYRYVKTNLTVLKDIPDPVGAIWVELMNEPDYYMTAITNTREGLIAV